MRKFNKVTFLWGILFFLSHSCLSAQTFDYSSDQIIGKWILKSASFNGAEVSLDDTRDQISFEFTNNGIVTLNGSDGTAEYGEYIIEENKLIDPDVPELLSANIINLSNDELILSMNENRDEVVMVFVLEGMVRR